MVGTGFNAEIVNTLMEFLRACYAGLLVKIEEGIPPEKAIKAEFKELEEYIWLVQGKMKELKSSLGK